MTEKYLREEKATKKVRAGVRKERNEELEIKKEQRERNK